MRPSPLRPGGGARHAGRGRRPGDCSIPFGEAAAAGVGHARQLAGLRVAHHGLNGSEVPIVRRLGIDRYPVRPQGSSGWPYCA